jgi:hypothetical protein
MTDSHKRISPRAQPQTHRPHSQQALAQTPANGIRPVFCNSAPYTPLANRNSLADLAIPNTPDIRRKLPESTTIFQDSLLSH